MSNANQLAGMKILVVDDEPDLAEVLCAELEYAGAQTKSVINAKSAISAIGENPNLDAIISDLNMPGGTGLDVATHWNNIPALAGKSKVFIIVTGDSPPIDPSRFPNLKFSLVGKPFEFEALIDLVSSLSKSK